MPFDFFFYLVKSKLKRPAKPAIKIVWDFQELLNQ